MIINKKKGLLNEFQVNLIYLSEMVNRLEIYNQLEKREVEVLRNLTETFIKSINEYINDINLKNKNDRSE